jgi:Na+/H+ antiporter NhaD/arsenite permease-like protein
LKALAVLRITSPRNSQDQDQDQRDCNRYFKRLHLPLNFVTAPLIADLFLLAIRAIGGKEVHDGIIGANGIAPYDIMLFFLSLAYIAISVDASGLIRWLALKVLQWGGDVGERLFFYLYAFFFALAAFCGNDPVILSGTAFLAYMTRVSVNIKLPTAWIYTQFAVANIASAILVSSNPTNLVLAGAFDIKFIHYTANMIVPVVVTAIVLFPFLLFIIFQDRSLVPYGKIEIHQLLQEPKDRAKAINPNIPHVNDAEDAGEKPSEETKKIRLLEEIFNPFLDKGGAAFGAIVMAVTLIVLLVVNATTPANSKAVPVFYITLPAALVMFCWDLGFGWKNRKETRRISRVAQQKSEEARAAREAKLAAEEGRAHPFSLEVIEPEKDAGPSGSSSRPPQSPVVGADRKDSLPSSTAVSVLDATQPAVEIPIEGEAEKTREASPTAHKRTTLESLVKDGHTWCQETFPSCTAVLAHLPYALVPFAFSMFVLVQALVTKGWVPVFAYGWDHWTNKTGTIGAIGGMGFLSVILCNVRFDQSETPSEARHQPRLMFYSLQVQTLEPRFFYRG